MFFLNINRQAHKYKLFIHNRNLQNKHVVNISKRILHHCLKHLNGISFSDIELLYITCSIIFLYITGFETYAIK